MQTVDFFTPVVDDPYDFGAIAAANALSDCYAMGAKPITALNIAAFPLKDLPLDTLHQILRGGADKTIEAEVAVLGGHTVDDKEPKFGLAVTGVINPKDLMTNSGGQAGDKLILTKPLGVGILTTAIKRGVLAHQERDQVVLHMKALNREAAEVAAEFKLRGATDVTGYGLLGHVHELAHASGLTAHLFSDRIPLLNDQVIRLAKDGVVPGGSRKNLAFIESWTEFESGVDEVMHLVLADAQTSGGLVLCVPPNKEAEVLGALDDRGLTAATIGELESGEAGHLKVHES